MITDAFFHSLRNTSHQHINILICLLLYHQDLQFFYKKRNPTTDMTTDKSSFYLCSHKVGLRGVYVRRRSIKQRGRASEARMTDGEADRSPLFAPRIFVMEHFATLCLLILTYKKHHYVMVCQGNVPTNTLGG